MGGGVEGGAPRPGGEPGGGRSGAHGARGQGRLGYGMGLYPGYRIDLIYI